MSDIIAVASGDGGSGKTMFSANLATVLAVSGYKTLLMDMNSCFSGMDIVIGIKEDIKYDISDVINGKCTVNKALVRSPECGSLFLLPASRSGDMMKLDEKLMKGMCRYFSKDFDYIIIDLPQSINEEWKTVISQVRKTVVLLTPEYSSLREAGIISGIIDKYGSSKKFAVVNKYKGEYCCDSTFPSVGEICGVLRFPVIGGIVEDEKIHRSMNSGVPVTLGEDNYIIRNFKRMFLRMYSRI